MTGARPPHDDPPDRLIGGRYRLGPVIGRGGMATVHRAHDERMDRDVALKLLRPEVGTDPDLAQRFRREALAATVLRHRNIVPCLDTGTDGDRPFLVMDLIDGEDLAARLRRGGRLAPPQVARIALDVARGLGVAHVRGIVHRDIKPGNILLATDGRAMITDFGIARLARDSEAAIPGTTLGSVHYFSPEQARGATTTPASDVYGLGLVMYEALTGTRAWGGPTSDAIVLARLGQPAPSPRTVTPEVPEALDAIVRRALAPEAGERYANGATMAAALEPIIAAGDAAATTTAAGATAPSPATAAATVSARPVEAVPAGWVKPGPSPVPGTPRGPGGVIGAFAAAAVVAAALLIAALPAIGGAGDRTATPAGSVLAQRSPEPIGTPGATPDPTPLPTASPTPAPDPTAEPEPDPGSAPPDVCEVFFEVPCGLDAGRYAPSRFTPAFDIELGDGWSSATHRADVMAFVRVEGVMTFASGINEVYPRGETREPQARARDLIEAFIATEGVGSTSPANVRIDGRRGLSIDVSPIDAERVPLFATDGTTFYLEPDRTSRIVAMDLRDGVLLLAIEPSEGRTLRDVLDIADPAAGTLHWR